MCGSWFFSNFATQQYCCEIRPDKRKIMDIEYVMKTLRVKKGLSETIGMEFFSTPEPDTCMAKMKVDERNRQPFGFLSGGASLALAENLAGVGSQALCPDKRCVGINVSGNHVQAVREGNTVTARGRLQFKGNTLHVWHIEITNENGDLISTVQVTNYILNPVK